MKRLLLALWLIASAGPALAGAFDSVAPFNGVSAFPVIRFNGPDGSPQAAVVAVPGATEYWQQQGGLPTDGATIYATNGTLIGNVDGDVVAQNAGTVRIGNGSGILGEFIDPGGLSGAYLQFKPSISGNASDVNSTASLISTGSIALVPNGAYHALMMNVPDGTIVGGNQRGQNAVDLQFTRTQANAVASGFGSVIVGGQNNRAAGNSYTAVVGGFNNLATSAFSWSVGGQNGIDDGRTGLHFFSNGIFTQVGDAQLSDTTMRGVSTGGAAVRLTVDGAVAGAANVFNLPASKTAAMTLRLSCRNFTTAAHIAGWFNTAILSRDATLASTTIALGTATTLGTDTVTVSATADTTLGGMNFTVTPPNTDTWHCALAVFASEAR